MFDNYIIRSESNVGFLSKINPSTPFNELRYKCVADCIIKDKTMSFILSWKRKQYQVRINKGAVTIQSIQKGEWTPLEPPFDQYFKK